MALSHFSSTKATSLASGMTSVATAVYLVDGSTYPDPAVPGNGQYSVILGYGSDREEVCTVIAKPGTNQLTVTRGQDGTAAVSKNIGDVVVHGVSARDFEGMITADGATMTGYLTLSGAPAQDLHAATKKYVDDGLALVDDGLALKAPNSRQVISGAGLTGGGDLSSDRTLAVGSGDGISVTADAVALDLTYADARYVTAAQFGAWTSYTPVLTASNSNPTLGTGSSAQGAYIQVDKFVVAQFRIAFGTSGTAAGNGIYYVSLPVAPIASWANRVIGNGELSHDTVGQPVTMRVEGTNTRMYMSFPATWPAGTIASVTHINLWAWDASDIIEGTIVYQAE